MGIPAFYRWLLERYPRSIEPAVEESPTVINGVAVPVDTSGPNPNDYEFDNLYLDMNGIVHPCFHPEGLPPPETYDEVFKAVFKYIDRIFAIIRPRKVLFMAIDGVAPRAKMNQQRARRFRAAKDAAEADSEVEDLRVRLEAIGEDLEYKRLDSNVITPGTEFMAKLSSALQYYVRVRMNEDPGWQGIKVIISDASVPGEGEHKIVSFIRSQRSLHGFDPNTRHCLYGLDADLILLALATHEVHFTVLREDVRKAQSKDRGSKHGKLDLVPECSNELENFISEQKFQLLRIWVLREYLAYDLIIPNSEFHMDLERVIDDFVFMCIFVGNDFLPHMPSLEITEGAIDLLMNVYQKEFFQIGGYLTNSVEVNLKRVEHFIQAVGSYENKIFRKRIQAKREFARPKQHHSSNSDPKGTKSHPNNQIALEDDKVKLGEDGWKDRYYAEKFGVETIEDCERVCRDLVLKYAEGICWVMHYYYQGVCSWQWFYPYHYAPFASDFHGLDQINISFTLGQPFKPFDQLMGVLPAARKLMTDPLSPILDFYPPDFELDINGKRHSWQAVCKLPFIDEFRLLSELAKVENTLTDEEKKRNSLGNDMLFLRRSHPLAERILSLYNRRKKELRFRNTLAKEKINPEFSNGMNGFISIYISEEPLCPMEIPSPISGMDMISNNDVICAFYELPPSHPHLSKVPRRAKLPGKVITKEDIQPKPVLWHEKTAIIRGRVSIKPVPPNSVSGSCLARLAHRLILENLNEKKQESGASMAAQAPPPNHDECPDNGNFDQCRKRKRRSEKNERHNRKKQENGVGVAVQVSSSKQKCPGNENLVDVVMVVQAPLSKQECPGDENLVVKKQENEVVQAPSSKQECPGNENLVVMKQENEIVQAPSSQQECPGNENLDVAKKQENGVGMGAKATQLDQEHSGNENLDDEELRKRKRRSEKNKERRRRKKQENGVGVAVQASSSKQKCPGNESLDECNVTKQENGVIMAVQVPLTKHGNENLDDECTVTKQENEVVMAVQAPLSKQEFPGNENLGAAKKQENEVGMAVQAPSSKQECPANENLGVVEKQEIDVGMAVQAPLLKQECPGNENLDDEESRKRKRRSEKNKERRRRKKLKLSGCNPSSNSSIGTAVDSNSAIGAMC